MTKNESNELEAVKTELRFMGKTIDKLVTVVEQIATIQATNSVILSELKHTKEKVEDLEKRVRSEEEHTHASKGVYGFLKFLGVTGIAAAVFGIVHYFKK